MVWAENELRLIIFERKMYGWSDLCVQIGSGHFSPNFPIRFRIELWPVDAFGNIPLISSEWENSIFLVLYDFRFALNYDENLKDKLFRRQWKTVPLILLKWTFHDTKVMIFLLLKNSVAPTPFIHPFPFFA